MLTGISETGTDHKDPMSFASELKLGTNSPMIELPNDADPTQECVKYARPPTPPFGGLDVVSGSHEGPHTPRFRSTNNGGKRGG